MIESGLTDSAHEPYGLPPEGVTSQALQAYFDNYAEVCNAVPSPDETSMDALVRDETRLYLAYNFDVRSLAAIGANVRAVLTSQIERL